MLGSFHQTSDRSHMIHLDRIIVFEDNRILLVAMVIITNTCI